MQTMPTINEMAIHVQEYMVEKHGNAVPIPKAKKLIKRAMKQGREEGWGIEQIYGAVINACKNEIAA